MCTISRTQCGDNVAESAQTLIDCLGFFEAVFVVCRATRRKSFRSSQILYTLISSAQGEKEKGKGRTTRFKEPSQASPVILFMPLTRNVKTEWDREERSFIQVVATARRDCACWRSEVTWLGPVSGTGYYLTKVCNSGEVVRTSNDLRDSRPSTLVMLNLVLAFIKFARPEKIVDRFVVLPSRHSVN